MMHSVSVTAYGVWIKARLKELLAQRYYDEIDVVDVARVYYGGRNGDPVEARLVAKVRKHGSKYGFDLPCEFHQDPVRRGKPFVVDPSTLARLILFLQ